MTFFGNSDYGIIECSCCHCIFPIYDNIPLASEFIDIILFFGILHHTLLKQKILYKFTKILKPGGYIILHEPIFRPSITPKILKKSTETSKHEERISKRLILNETYKTREIINLFEGCGIFFGAMMRFFGKFILKNKKIFRFIEYTDLFFIKLLERFHPALGPGDIRCAIKKY
jgi:CRISPR/Cas system-associated protein endoribonuclease Cas2